MAGLKIPWVTGSLMIVTSSEDGVVEGVLWRNIDTPFVCEDMIIKLPVREARPEGSGMSSKDDCKC